MRVYFLSKKTCALTIGGAYLGLVDGFERSVELSPQDDLFCEFKPQDGLPLRFCLNEDFLIEPPEGVALYYTGSGVAVCAERFPPADPVLKVIRQARFGGSLLTLMRQGGLKLSLENETGFHLTDLDDALETCTFSARKEGFLLSAADCFCLVSREGEVLLFSEGRVREEDGVLRAEVPFHDCLGHTALCEWRDGKLSGCTIRTPHSPTAATFALALFESALIGADVRPFLADSLAEKADSLKAYLGDFRSVVLTGERDRVGLVFPRRPRVFDVRYFRVETEDGKVTNILPEH